MSNKHVIEGVTSADMMSAYGVILSRVVDPENPSNPDVHPIGLIANLNFQEQRPVSMQGELGSQKLLALINEGQKSMSFNRLLPYPDTKNVYEDNQSYSPKGSILSALYAPELEDEGVTPDIIAFDIEQYAAFRKPITLELRFLDEDGGDVAIIWLVNASVAGANISIGAGSQMSMEPTQISWEDTEHQDIGNN